MLDAWCSLICEAVDESPREHGSLVYLGAEKMNDYTIKGNYRVMQ
jgi:hypothetical protein